MASAARKCFAAAWLASLAASCGRCWVRAGAPLETSPALASSRAPSGSPRAAPGAAQRRWARAVGRRAWDDWIPDLPKEYHQIGPLKLGPRPRPFGLLLMPLLLFVASGVNGKKFEFRRMDANADKVVTMQEFRAAGRSEAAFLRLDGDADGKLDEKDYIFSFSDTT